MLTFPGPWPIGGRAAAPYPPPALAPAPARHAPGTPVLPAAALPGMSVTERALTVTDLTHDAPIPGFAGKLTGWNYQVGAQRVFVGQSKVFSNVVSRTLRFGAGNGARAYVDLVA